MEDWGQFVLIDVSRKNYSYTRLNDMYEMNETDQSGQTNEIDKMGEIYKMNEIDKINRIIEMNELHEMNEIHENNKTRSLSYIIKKILFSIFYLSLKITYCYIYNETGLGIGGHSRVFSSRYLL